MKNYLSLDDISAYKLALSLSKYIYDIVMRWNYFDKDTVGKQLVRSTDSISANIAEGFGRYFKRDKIKFYYYSHASIYETKDWLRKANSRNLLTAEHRKYLLQPLQELPREINNLIKFTNSRLKY